MKSRTVRAAGAVLLAGSLAWAVTALIAPSSNTRNSQLELFGGLMFQLGLGAYLAVVLKLKAAGHRWGQRIVVAESVLLVLAAAWSVDAVARFSPTVGQQGFIMTALDAAWPLSMLGLAAVAIAIARARVFPGATRWVPLLASLWLVADLAALAISPALGPAIHLAWLVGPYGLLAMVLLLWLPRQLGNPATPAAEVVQVGR